MAERLYTQSLPSETTFYKQFKETSQTCSDPIADSIKTILSKPNKEDVSADQIKRAVCHVCGMYNGRESSPFSDPCYFLYFWLGDMIPVSVGNDVQFPSQVNILCTAIEGEYKTKGCKLICTENLDRKTFHHRKTIFEYYYDYKSVEKDLKEGEPNCNDSWSSYRNAVLTACKAVNVKCPEGADTGASADPYCKHFKDKYKFYCGTAQALDSYCTTKSQLESLKSDHHLATSAKESTQSKLNEAESKANAASSLSSAFGTLAAIELPALAYFLYKYKPWSSLFGNHTGGGSRNARKRRSNIQRNLDDLTEDTSTIGYTESSETSSTFHPTTVRSPAAHTIQTIREGEGRASARRTNSNTLGRQNVGYGRM